MPSSAYLPVMAPGQTGPGRRRNRNLLTAGLVAGPLYVVVPVSWHGVLRFVVGGIGFLGLFGACQFVGRRLRRESRPRMAVFSHARLSLIGSELSAVDGPFAESKEVISYAIYEVRSKEEVVEWATRFLKAHRDLWLGWEIVRAKRTLATAGVRFTMPTLAEITDRTSTVLGALYLIFNEGRGDLAGVRRTTRLRHQRAVGRPLADGGDFHSPDAQPRRAPRQSR